MTTPPLAPANETLERVSHGVVALAGADGGQRVVEALRVGGLLQLLTINLDDLDLVMAQVADGLPRVKEMLLTISCGTHDESIALGASLDIVIDLIDLLAAPEDPSATSAPAGSQ